MKILFCSNTFENVQNGPSKFARAVLGINDMQNNSVEISILTEDVSENSTLLSEQKVFKVHIKLNRFTRPWGFVYRMFPYYSALKKIKQIYPYDIIVFNNAITGICSALFQRTPVIGMINDDTSATTGFHNFSWSHEWFRRMLFKMCEKLAAKSEKGIIVNSKFLFHKVLETYKPTASNLKILYKGVRTDKTLPLERPMIQSPIKILFVKSDFKRGGLWDVGKALSILQDYTFELIIVGPDFQNRDLIETEIKAANVAVRFIGPAAEEHVFDLMRTSDLFVVPSYHEALGVANMEAILHGIPVISSNQGGIPEVLNDEKNGWMTSPGCPEKLADIISEVINNPASAEKKSIDGYHFVRQHFDIENSLSEFVKIISSYL